MERGKTTFNCWKNQTYELTLNCSDASGAIDWTGYTFLFQVRKSPTDATVVATANVTGNSSGVITITIDDSDTDFEQNTYYADLRITSPGGVVDYLIGGTWNQWDTVSR